MPHLITDLEAIHRLAAQHREAFEIMRYYLEYRDDLSDEYIDAEVEKIAAPIVDAIDCTACANCCRSLDVYLTPTDAQRLASGIDVPLHTIETQHIEHQQASQQGEWGKFRGSPCTFLRGNLCSVYTHRPQTCRTYPAFTPDFRWTLADTIQGASLCPIIYNVLARLLKCYEDL